MHADFPATIPRLRCCRWLLMAALMLANVVAWGEHYQAQDDSLHTVFTALSLPLGLPIVVSREVARKRFSGVLDLDAPQQTLEALALQQGLIWYSDGQVLYVYDAGEAKSSAVTLRHISIDRLRALMRRSGLDESSYSLRASGGRTFYVSGPPSYVDQVLHLARMMDRQRADLRVGTQAFGVVQVLNSAVADRQYGSSDRPVTVPGMASMIESVLSSELKGALADKSLAVIAYPDTNSLLIKGKPAQVSFIQALVAELDLPKRSIEVSLWLVDVDQDELKKLGLAGDDNARPMTTQLLKPSDDNRLMAHIAALERKRRARVVTLPVMMTQENVPAVFQDNYTFYLPAPGEEEASWKPVRYATQVSVLPRFAEANQIEMLIDIEDGRPMTEAGRHAIPTAVGQVGVGSVVRVEPGKRLWLGVFRRDTGEQRRGTGPMRRAEVRLFVIQAQAVGSEVKTLAGGVGPPPLTASQYERVQRAFVRPGRDISP